MVRYRVMCFAVDDGTPLVYLQPKLEDKGAKLLRRCDGKAHLREVTVEPRYIYLIRNGEIWLAMEVAEGLGSSLIISLLSCDECPIDEVRKAILRDVDGQEALSLGVCDIKSSSVQSFIRTPQVQEMVKQRLVELGYDVVSDDAQR